MSFSFGIGRTGFVRVAGTLDRGSTRDGDMYASTTFAGPYDRLNWFLTWMFGSKSIPEEQLGIEVPGANNDTGIVNNLCALPVMEPVLFEEDCTQTFDTFTTEVLPCLTRQGLQVHEFKVTDEVTQECTFHLTTDPSSIPDGTDLEGFTVSDIKLVEKEQVVAWKYATDASGAPIGAAGDLGPPVQYFALDGGLVDCGTGFVLVPLRNSVLRTSSQLYRNRLQPWSWRMSEFENNCSGFMVSGRECMVPPDGCVFVEIEWRPCDYGQNGGLIQNQEQVTGESYLGFPTDQPELPILTGKRVDGQFLVETPQWSLTMSQIWHNMLLYKRSRSDLIPKGSHAATRNAGFDYRWIEGSFALLWKDIPNPSWDCLCRYQGTINSRRFLNFPPKSLYFVGYEPIERKVHPWMTCWDIRLIYEIAMDFMEADRPKLPDDNTGKTDYTEDNLKYDHSTSHLKVLCNNIGVFNTALGPHASTSDNTDPWKVNIRAEVAWEGTDEQREPHMSADFTQMFQECSNITDGKKFHKNHFTGDLNAVNKPWQPGDTY